MDGIAPVRNEDAAMYSRNILLAAASLAVAGVADTAIAMPLRDFHPLAREAVRASLQLHHYRFVSDPYFFRGRYVARSIDPSGRVVLVEINPQNGAFIGEILI
jgi:hypothetical protein